MRRTKIYPGRERQPKDAKDRTDHSKRGKRSTPPNRGPPAKKLSHRGGNNPTGNNTALTTRKAPPGETTPDINASENTWGAAHFITTDGSKKTDRHIEGQTAIRQHHRGTLILA